MLLWSLWSWSVPWSVPWWQGGCTVTDLDRLHTDAVLTMGELAAILKLHHGRKPSLDRRAAHNLVRTGKLRLVNPDETNTTRWTVTTIDVRTYLQIDTPSTGRILWNDRGGEIDELVMTNCTVHIEQMADNCWWIGIFRADGGYWAGNFHTKRAPLTFTQQEHEQFTWNHEGPHT
jgi:hypothetical protein